jgi:hypothetical protein
VRREAVLSSKIEGTQATLGELLAAEAGATVDRSPDDLREERARIVKQVGAAKRDRVYCATALLEILEEPARLK